MYLFLNTILAFAVLSNTLGHAETLRVDLTGRCPNRGTLTSAFADLGIETVGEADVRAKIVSSKGRVSLQLVDASNESLVSREIESRDCAAIAEIFALIVSDALSLRLPPVPSLMPAQRNIATAPTVELTNPDQSAKAVVVKTRPKTMVSAPSAMVPATKGATAPNALRHYALGLSRGYRNASLSADSSTFYQAELRVDMGEYWWRSVLALDEQATNLGIGLRQQQYAARAELGLTFAHSRFWIRPSAGLGIVLSSFSSTADDTYDFIRLHPTLAASLMPGINVSKSFSIHLLFEGFFYPITDRYLSETMVLGESTRASSGVSLGAQWRFGL